MSEKYILIRFPEVQELMDEEWFRQECYLCQAFEDQEHIDSAYFVPTGRLKERDDNLSSSVVNENTHNFDYNIVGGLHAISKSLARIEELIRGKIK